MLSRATTTKPSFSSRRRTSLAFVLLGLSSAVNAFPLISTGGAIDFSSYEHIIAFGDSYTANGYNPANGINNNTAASFNTTANGPTWIEWLAASNPTINASLQYYNFADFGATTNNSIIPSEATDFVHQVGLFKQYLVPAPPEAPWTSANTLFAIWVGINDVGFSFVDGIPFPAAQPALLATWNNLIASLYSYGARDFLVLGLPSTEFTPLIQSYGPGAVSLFRTTLDAYNLMLSTFIPAIPKALSGTKTTLFDTQPFFDALIQVPLNYGFTDSISVCPAYVNVTNDPFIDSPLCPWPFIQYVWRNTYHPTWPVHKLLATVIIDALNQTLETTPSGTPTTTGIMTATPYYIPTQAPSDTSARSVASATLVISTQSIAASAVSGVPPSGTATRTPSSGSGGKRTEVLLVGLLSLFSILTLL